MKKITFLMSFILLLSWQGMTQTTLYLTTSGGSYATEKWVDITDGPNGTGNVLWAQGNGTYGNGQGLVTDSAFTVVDGTTYYINCYDRYDDGWDGTTYQIRTAPAGGGILVVNNGGISPNDGNDVDASSVWEVMDDERESSEAFSYMPAACMQPSSLVATSITVNSASLGWTENGTATTWNVEWGVTGFTQGTGNMITGTSNNPEPITSLSASTSYEFYVQADCGGSGTSAWVGPFSFVTACNVFNVPFQEGFNTSSTTESCWKVINNNADADAWDLNYTTTPYEGDQVAVIYTDFNAGANDDYLISPQINLTGNEQLRFYHKVQSGSEPNDFKVLISTSGNDTPSFTTELSNITSSSTTYQEVNINLSAYSVPVYIAFQIPTGGLDGWRLYIDDVNIEALPSCPVPSTLTATNITGTTADLGWTENGTATTWNVEWGVTGFSQGTGTMVTGTTNNPEPIAGLTSSTSYEFYVQADCGSDSSAWVGPFAFTTLCVAPVISSFPWTENFDAVSTPAMPCGWLVDNVNADAYTWVTGTTASSAPNSMQVRYNTTDAANDWSFTPELVLVGGQTYELSFAFAVAGATYPEKLKVMYGSAQNVAGMTTLLFDSTLTNTVFDTAFTTFTPATSGSYYIGFHNYSDANMFRVYVDDVTLKEAIADTCSIPSNLTAFNITQTSAMLDWTENGNATEWNIEWGFQGFTIGTGTPVHVLSKPYLLNGLMPNTPYDYYVQADCGTDSSAWVGPYTFMTPPCMPIGLELGNDTTLCPNQSLTLNAPAGGPYSYSWSTSESTQSITVDTASLGGNGTYNITVSVIDFSTNCFYNDNINVTFSVCTGVNENVASNFTIYPNPTDGWITVKTVANDKGTLEVTNLQGKLVYKNTLNSNTQNIDLSANAKGVYFVTVTTTNSVEIQKMVIQ